MSGHELAEAVRSEAARHATAAQGVMQLAEVLDNDPFTLELLESRATIHDDELVLSQWVKRYHAADTIDPKDTVVVLRKVSRGVIHWVIVDVIAEKTPS